MLEEAKAICAIPAPTFAEAERARTICELFGEFAADVRQDAVGNVICTLGDRAGQTPAVVFAAHMDTVVPLDQPIEIDHDERAGRVRAPGIGDNSLGVAALVHLARRLAGTALHTPLILAATVGEEGLGDLRGAKHLVQSVACESFIAVEGQMVDSIKTGAVGSTRHRITYGGGGGHPWGDRATPSAIHGLIERTAALLREPRDPGLVVNVGRIGGGTSINSIAAEAMLELDLRAEDASVLAAAAASARAIYDSPPDGLKATIEPLGHRPSGRLPPDHGLVQEARRARRDAGLAPAREGASSTDANAAYGQGIPAVTVGVTTGGNAHRPDEYIDVAPLAGGLLALELFARALVAR